MSAAQAGQNVPEAVPVLMQANLTSAFSVAEMPESTFLDAYSNVLGEETARQVYTQAINSRISGRIYLALPDDARSFIAGTFDAEIRRPPPPKPPKGKGTGATGGKMPAQGPVGSNQ